MKAPQDLLGQGESRAYNGFQKRKGNKVLRSLLVTWDLRGPMGQTERPGIDRNTNVRSFSFDLSSVSGSRVDQPLPELTQEVLENDLVLMYLKIPVNTYSTWHPLPANKINLRVSGQTIYVGVNLLPGTVVLGFSDMNSMAWTAIMEGDLGTLKIIIAEAKTSNSGKSDKFAALSQFKVNGIALDDYYAVMDYFGLEY